MKAFKNHNPVRDVLLALLLLVLLKPALRRLSTNLTKSSQTTHSHPFSIHEPDQKVLDTIKTTKKQLQQSVNLAQKYNKNDSIERLDRLIHKLETVKERYEKNSPALFFLGPIGTISIVLKEIALESKISDIIDELDNELLKLTSRTQSTEKSLQKN